MGCKGIWVGHQSSHCSTCYAPCYEAFLSFCRIRYKLFNMHLKSSVCWLQPQSSEIDFLKISVYCICPNVYVYVEHTTQGSRGIPPYTRPTAPPCFRKEVDFLDRLSMGPSLALQPNLLSPLFTELNTGSAVDCFCLFLSSFLIN